MFTKKPTLLLLLLITLHYLISIAHSTKTNQELEPLLDLKSTLDPTNKFLSSWSSHGDPCDGTFEGIGCNEMGQVANISLQGKGLTGQLSPSISKLKHLSGLYLHYNMLYGVIPKEVFELPNLVDLYLNVNNFSGVIASEIRHLESLQVLQLCYNQLTGSIPTHLGSLKKLTVIALQSNNLTGAIPASLGGLEGLIRLDLSFNQLFGSIPTPVAEAPLLQSFDIRNNTLSGNVPPSLQRLSDGFKYTNNPGLCGVGYLTLQECSDPDHLGQTRPEPYSLTTSHGTRTKDIPETANIQPNCIGNECPKLKKKSHTSTIVGIILVALALSTITTFFITKHRRTKQKLGTTTFELTENPPREYCRKNGSPLISLEYPNGWDPLSDGRGLCTHSTELMSGFRFNLEEVESATQHFSQSHLLGKSGLCAVYRGVLRDGSNVAVKKISKSSCKSEESEFLKGLNLLTKLQHDNLVRLRGFCCSRGRGECFLVYDFVSNGDLLRYLDLKAGDSSVLEWSTRVRIIHGIAKGIQYLHSNRTHKQPLTHQNISAKKILLNHSFNPTISDSGIHKLLTNDTVFSSLKASAAMGYLAPEYTTTGKFTDKSDVYAFGMLVFQILSGKRKIPNNVRVAAESSNLNELIDHNIQGKFSEFEALKIAKVALSCIHDVPGERPNMDLVVLELGGCSGCYRSP